jgi:hypothetical protein
VAGPEDHADGQGGQTVLLSSPILVVLRFATSGAPVRYGRVPIDDKKQARPKST